MFKTVTKLDIQVPPMLEEALGYAGQERYVAFYWESAGDELAYDDGINSVCGANWAPWLAFKQHARVYPSVQGAEWLNSN